MSRTNYKTIEQVVASTKYPFTESQLRSLTKSRDKNGMEMCCKKIGKRLWIDEKKLDEWVESRGSAISRYKKKVKRPIDTLTNSLTCGVDDFDDDEVDDDEVDEIINKTINGGVSSRFVFVTVKRDLFGKVQKLLIELSEKLGIEDVCSFMEGDFAFEHALEYLNALKDPKKYFSESFIELFDTPKKKKK